MASKFYALLTTRGEAKLAQAVALGTQLKITQMAVGDGGGAIPTPNASQTKLVNQQRIAAINTLSVDPVNTSQIIAEQVIPEDEGGWWIREVGLFDDAGELIAVANCAETYKPQLAEGSGRTQVIRMIVVVSSTEAVTLKIDPSVVLATRNNVDDKVIEVKAYTDSVMKAHLDAADPHPQYAPKASPTFTGSPKAPTPANGNNTTLLATTQFVQAAIGLLKGDAPAALDTLAELAAAINNDPAFYSTMASQLALKAAIAGPTFTGVPKAPTAVNGNNTTQLATTAFVQSAIAQLVASSPAALDTLKELADALGNDPNFATTMTNALAGKMDIAKNGSDIANVSAFLANLGLGEAAKMPAASAVTNGAGWLSIPVLIGGVTRNIILQWKSVSIPISTDGTMQVVNASWPVAFPTACLSTIQALTNSLIYATNGTPFTSSASIDRATFAAASSYSKSTSTVTVWGVGY